MEKSRYDVVKTGFRLLGTLGVLPAVYMKKLKS